MRDGSGTALSQPLSLLDRGKHAVLDKVVLSKVREKLGGECQRLEGFDREGV